MKSAVYNGKTVTLTESPIPRLLNTQVLIRIKACGICGTDLAIANGDLPSLTPIILGHEFSGEIIELGSQVDNKWLGKRIVCEINSNICGKCYFCSRNIPTQCISRKALGIDLNG